MLVPFVSLDQKSDVVPHFNHLDLMNEIVTLTMPSASHDAIASTKYIILPKKVTLHVILLILTKNLHWGY